jgi:hypothetical protein
MTGLKATEDAIISRLVKWAVGIAAGLAVPLVMLIFQAGSIVSGMHDWQARQDTVNIKQERFNSRQLQYDEMFKGQIAHLGHLLSKMDTSGAAAKNK